MIRGAAVYTLPEAMHSLECSLPHAVMINQVLGKAAPGDREADPWEVFFAECPLMAVIADAQGRVLRANARMLDGLGLSAAEASAMTISALVHPDDAGAAEASLRALDVPGKQASWISRAPSPPSLAEGDCAERWLRWWCVRSSRGGIFATAADVTPWTQDGYRQRNNEARLQAIVREAPLAIIEFGSSGKILSWNPGAARLFGYSAEEAIGRTSEDLIEPPGRKGDTARTRRAVLERDGLAATMQNVTKDGRLILCEWQLLLARDGAGEVLSVAALVRDVTAKVSMVEELRRSRDVLRLMLDNVPLIVWTADMNGVFTYAEGLGLSAINARAGELVGQSFFERFRDYPLVVDSVWRALQGDDSLHTTEFGGKVWENRYLVIRDDDGQMLGVAGMSMDMTERVRTEQELRARLATIDRQKSAIRSLSMPIVEVWDGVLALPVIGEVDAERAEGVTEALLDAVVRARAKRVIIDLTGVELIDTASVSRLLKVVDGVGLVGSSAVVTGIRPHIANIMVSLDVDMARVRTLRNLRDAIKLSIREGVRAR